MTEVRFNPGFLRHFLLVAWATLLAACIPQPNDPPAGAPTSLVAAPGNATVSLTWSGVSGATGYSVQRATVHNGPYTRLATPATNSYVDSAVLNGTTYFYVVSAYNKGGETTNSPEASAIPAVPSIPVAPTNVTTTSGDRSATISWSAVAGATSYHVKRALVSGGSYTQVGAPAATTFTDSLLINGTTYFYVVSAVNALGESPNSAQVTATPAPAPPTTFGTWTNVTPSGVDLSSSLCSNFGARTVQVDPAHPGSLYTAFDCQGIWKSSDYGLTWTGPINTGTNGAQAADCSGGITIAPGSTASVPTIFQACIRGTAIGFWKSVDGGVSWTKQVVVSPGARQDYLPPVVDPYDANHLLMVGHEFDSIVESVDAGVNWTSVPLANGMLQSALNGSIFFINTGSSTTTRKTWLWMGAPVGGTYGTWRTADSGAHWVQVDKNEGTGQIYQPDTSGVVFIAGNFSALGSGVLRSTDYGLTWTHVGLTLGASITFGTPKNVYSMFGAPVGPGGTFSPNFQVGSQPGTGTWVTPSIAAGFNQGPGQISVLNDGTHNIFVGAMWNIGLWRYVEP